MNKNKNIKVIHRTHHPILSKIKIDGKKYILFNLFINSSLPVSKGIHQSSGFNFSLRNSCTIK
jgi:hypothetical protein